MRKTLEELFYGNLTPNEQQITPDSPLQQAMDQAEEYEEKLTALLEGEEKTMLLRDRKSTRLNSSHVRKSRMPSSA